MSLNNMHLPGSLLCDLYRKSLYQPDDTAAATMASPAAATAPDGPAPLRFLGQHQKKILLLVNYPDIPFLPDPQLDFLTNILKACRLTLADVAIVNAAANSLPDYQQLQKEPGYRFLLMFGLDAASVSLAVNFPAYQVQAFSNATYLVADPLEEIEGDKELKTKLWVCLKKMFGV